MLARWGSFVYRRRWVVLVLSVGLIALSIAGVLKGASPSFNGNTTGTESASAYQLIKQELRAQNAHSLTLLYRSGTLTAGDPTFQAALQDSIRPLQADPRLQSIITPYDGGPAAASLVSRDQHEALAIITLKDDQQASKATYSDLHAELRPSGPLQVLGTGGLAIDAAVTTELGHDLSTTSRTSLPITALLPAGLRAEHVSFRSGDLVLHGTIWAQEGPSRPRPGIALVHGSGPGPRTAYELEAQAFARAGIVTLAYDKRTVGYSMLDRDYGLLAQDALAAVKLLRSRADVDPALVGLWGESEGTWVVPLAAAGSPDVAFVILVGASGVSPSRQQAWFLDNWLRRNGVSGSMVTSMSSNGIRFAVSAGVFPEADFDTVPSLRRLSQPVLALWSSRDYSHPPAEASGILQRALDSGGNARYTIRFLHDADPGLHRTTDGWDRLDGLAPGYVDLVSTWIGAVAAGGPPGSSVEPTPRQDRESTALAPSRWYESARTQLVVIVLSLVMFAGALVTGIVCRVRRGACRVSWQAHLLAISGPITTFGLVVYLPWILVLAPPGPVVGGRPVPWLTLQALAALTVILTAVLAAVWWRRRPRAGRAESFRLGLLVGGGVLVTLLAAYWGLLMP